MKSIAELETTTFVKHYNNPKLSNEALCKKLDTEWSIVNRKAKSSKSVSAQLTMYRSRKNGQSVFRPMDAAELAAASESTAVASTSAVARSGAINIKFLCRNDNDQVIINEAISAENGEDLVVKLRNMMRENRITKVDLFRAGAFINASDIVDGDEIVARAKLEAAAV